ncbi:Hydroxymethylglutaryl-CoA synthase [Nakaseomyces glabratus]|nr:Hydroxymethylglutaryl-CoA synthase [Nakaseomyces glabratus]KTB17860.1 Hydroxymethylglutaryl-CoA synthase [Nakaseomyces glabratus]KTB20993.1 Hydroxymethylglutaryl-CoA synthase [Nakaseomyces glabratus]KTB26203.1 Hydroxymethylglutaryl-CoA synthase [Nakaseomyces glabratus]
MTEIKKQRTDFQAARPTNVGIKGIEVYIPSQYVSEAELEKYDGVSQGKYTIGLGQTNMSFVNDREDIYSIDEACNVLKHFDYNVFHVPTCKLVTKSYGRLLYNDFRGNPSLYPDVDQSLATLDYEKSLVDKSVEKLFVNVAKPHHATRVAPSLNVPTNTGNMYTGSVYASLASLLSYVDQEQLQGKRIGMFSYGSGLAASLFSLVVRGDISDIVSKLDIDNKLQSRECLTPQQYEAAIELREKAHLQKSFKPTGSIDHLRAGTYYLTEIDDKFRRSYSTKE